MKQLLCILFLACGMKALAQPDTTLAVGKCDFCDTVFKKNNYMPDGSRMIRKVTCYYTGSKRNHTGIYSITRYKNGLKHGLDRGYYRKEEGLYITLFMKPYKKQPPSLFIRVLHETIGFYPSVSRYESQWKNGELQSAVYYDLNQKSVDSLGTVKYVAYDAYLSKNIDQQVNGDNQVSTNNDGDTLWRWNVRNNKLDGDFLMFDKQHRVKWQYTLDKGQLIEERQFRRGKLRHYKKYDSKHGPVFIEAKRYNADGELRSHHILGEKYSYRAQKYMRVKVPQ